MSPPPQLSVVVPAYNEQHRIEQTLREMAQFFAERRVLTEIIVVADGCADETAQRVERLARSFPEIRCMAYQPNRGKGYALRLGMKATVGEWVLFADADGATPIAEYDKLRLGAAGAADVAIASRQAVGAILDPPQSWTRRFLGRMFSVFTQQLLDLPIQDTQCGFKLFPGALARNIAAKATLDRFAIDLELLVLAKKAGAAIHEIGVVWKDQAGSSVRAWRDGKRMLRDAWVLRRMYF